MSNLPKLAPRAIKALDVLDAGGQFRYGLERSSYTGREQFTYRLKAVDGSTIKGVGHAAFQELKALGFLAAAHNFSGSTYYKLNREGIAA